MATLKRMALRALMLPGAARLFSPLLRDRAVILMMHRFRQPDIGIEGHDADDVRKLLEFLRRRRCEIVSLEEVFKRLAGEGPAPAGCIAFTLDDGYRDQAEVAGPLFEAFDCPSTTFVTSGFLDGQLWFWWDRIDYVFHETEHAKLELRVDGQTLSYAWSDGAERERAQYEFTELCKTVADSAKHQAIANLAEVAEVSVPEQPPPAYAPMTWDQLRACEAQGMRFGAHTVTHPVLSRTDDGQSKRELEEGWARLRTEAAHPVPIFCYPNGQFGDFGPREITTLRQLGMKGAVVGAAGHGSSLHFQRDESEPFQVRRFSYPAELSECAQLVSGFERFKQTLRREDAP
jgi:peptidoglycan/xylan/chitin deacetylase (PgdA/CDA1 family)